MRPEVAMLDKHSGAASDIRTSESILLSKNGMPPGFRAAD